MMNDKTKGDISQYRAPAVSRAFEILKAVANTRSHMGISQIARRLALSKSTTHGLVRSLLQIGALEHNPHSNNLCLGSTLIELVFQNQNYLHVREKAQPELNRICRLIEETVFLGLLSRDQATIIASAEADKAINISSPPGTSIPLLSGAVGKVALAQGSKQAAQVYLQTHPLPRFTPNSIIGKTDYLKEVERARQRGYALDNEEYLPGVRAVAASLNNRDGLPMAIWVVGFSTSMVDGRLEEIAQQTVSGAQALRRILDN
jgi:DNA-binding IclR family transcriptional regulator